MEHPRIVLAGAGVVLAAVIAGCGASTGGGSGSGTTSALSGGTTQSAGAVHTMQAMVGGKSETILVDASGMPLYYYQPDTATSSAVSGALASAWPPVPGSGTTSVAGGQLGSITDSHGSQATYNGHPLYTFVSDQAGVVTGQAVENFFLATPGLAPLFRSAPATGAPADSGGYGGYGY